MKEVYLNQTQNLDKWNKQANTFTKPQYIINNNNNNKIKNQKSKDKDLRRPTFWVDYDWEKERKWKIDGVGF